MAGERPAKRGLELAIQRIILGSRWLQAPLYLGLVAVLASSIVAISSIHLLQRFLEANTVANDRLIVLMAMHLTFVVSALLLTHIDRLATAKNIDSVH